MDFLGLLSLSNPASLGSPHQTEGLRSNLVLGPPLVFSADGSATGKSARFSSMDLIFFLFDCHFLIGLCSHFAVESLKRHSNIS